MLGMKIGTLNVKYENHSDLLTKEYEKAEKNLLTAYEKIRQKTKDINEIVYCNIRLNPGELLVLGKIPKHPPIIFAMSISNGEYSFDIEGKTFEKLANPDINAILEDICNNIDKMTHLKQDPVIQKISDKINDLER